MKKNILLTAILCCLMVSLHAQVTLSGKVTGKEYGEPLTGVNIRVDNSLTGGTTNGKGEFCISNLPEGKHNLSFTYVGYAPLHFTFQGSNKDIHIVMEESYNNIGQVVVTGTGTHKRMTDSPVPVSVITAKEISSANVSTLEEALVKLTPNISSYTNGMGTTMSLNGINEDYVLILENGKRLAGEDRYTRINVANIKRVEILNGAASALYGSDAIGGVINIITDDAKNTLNISNYTHYSSEGRWTEAFNADVNAGKLSSYTSYQRLQAGSWQNNNIDENGNLTGKPTSVGFYSNTVNQRFVFNATDKLSFYVRGTYYDNKTRRPQDATYFTYDKKKKEYVEKGAYTYNLKHETYTYGAGMKYMINRSAYIDAEFYSDNFSSDYVYFKKSGSFQPGDEVTRKKVHYYNGNVKGIFRIGSHNRLSVGMEYVNEQLKSESDNIPFKNMYTMALYAQDEIKLMKNLQAVLGLRYIYNENFKNHATPNVALMYKLGDLNLRAAYAAGFRTPTLSQLYATDESKTSSRYTVGNPNLKPEKNNYYSLNAEYNYQWISVSVTGFMNDIRDMINYRTLSDKEIAAMGLDEKHAAFDEIRQRDNVDKAKTKGLSFNATINLGAGFRVSGGYTYMDTKAKQLQTDGTYKESPIDKSIRHMGNINGQWEHSWSFYRLNVNLHGRLQGERYSQTYGYAPKYQQWDLNTRHTFNLRSFILEPGVGIENIFDKIDDRPWNNNFSTLNPGRSVYVSLAVRFNK
ncbi:TonB-dependent receptor [Bacteroides helcogenes]|uniref:TonB-dependent receptor n=1 Tax=Bacteroides helcogenes (strain ATCC 35417 / DSM 20613 / JCM 6297 / CCUG 15421 / P 36-108) TaxID=693979 RepID=E6SSW0_BACT6|nr:TonB-dependent receptor [Bacteroides helcogenes]ADV44191.1 TonB-dependent receptor [Bacteroides helcogenes P 36-108]MDY5238394.1 TonB-dependent receptor [Bacteroides helcogenes]